MDLYHSFEEIVKDIVKSDKQEEKHLRIILELFVVHISANKTTALYVSIIIGQAEGHIENILSNTEKEQWFLNLNNDQKKKALLTQRKRFFKNVSNAVKQLYFLLRASLNLDCLHFSQKYSYIPQTNFEMICVAARAVRREDYFLFGCISIAYQSTQGRGFEVTELIDTLSQCAAAELPNVIAKDLRTGHPLLETVKNTLMEKNKCFKKFSVEFKPTIVKMLKEYCAADNPFAQRFPALDKSLQNVSLTIKDGALPYLLPKTKAPRMTRNEQCQSDVLNVLATLENKPAQSSIPDVSSSSSSSSLKAMSSNSGLLSAKPKVHRDVNPFSAVAQFLSKHKISKTQALQFFYNKKMRLNEMEDCIVSSQGFRTYLVEESNTNENEILAAGVLTCILHTIRLLFVGGLLEASNPQYSLFQSLLNKMVSKMNSWTVDEVLREIISFNLSEMDPINRFESFVLKFSNEYPKLFTVLPTITWSKFLTPESQQSSVQELYNSSTQRDQRASIFFLAFTDAPSSDISLPYSFRCNSPSYAPISTDENGAIDPEKTSEGKTCLQLVGLIYAAKQFSFQFVTFSRSREDGQYQVFRLNQYGIVDLFHAVPYPETTRAGKGTYSVKALPLLASDPSGQPLVGLILVRNDNLLEDENRHYLSEPVIQTIKDNCSYTTRTKAGFNNYCKIFGSSLKTFSSPTAWLKDEVIHGIINLMCDHLKSKFETTVANTFYLCTSLTYQRHICERRPLRPKALSNFRDPAFSVYIINMDNTHWICGCSSKDRKTIYLLDSYNSKSSVESKAKEIISFFKECVGIPGYKYVMLPSSDQTQEDYYNCGVFAILNAIIFLKSIFEGRFDPEYLQKRTPRIFTPEDKITLRATMRRVLERTEEIGCLLQWI